MALFLVYAEAIARRTRIYGFLMVDIHRYLWMFMDVYGYSWIFMDIYGYLCFSNGGFMVDIRRYHDSWVNLNQQTPAMGTDGP